MDLPIRFPSDDDVIREETARFRALSPTEQIASIRGMIRVGGHLLRMNPNAARVRDEQQAEAAATHYSIREFIKRHGR